MAGAWLVGAGAGAWRISCDLYNCRLKRAGIRLLVASGFFRGQGDGPAYLSPDEERRDERGEAGL